MQEVFYEESSLVKNAKSAKTRYTIFKIFSIISYILAVLCWLVVITWGPFDPEWPLKTKIISIIEQILPIIIFLVSGIFLGRLKYRMFVDYDYTFVTGSIRISKIFMHKKRKHLLNFSTSEILQMGKYGSESYEKLSKTPNLKKLILTSNDTPSEGNDFYYLHVSTDNGNKLLIFDCSETFMATVLRYSNKMILEKDYK